MILDLYNQTAHKVSFPLRTAPGDGIPIVIHPSIGVRRITITEAERLQGFKDGYTMVPWRGKAAEKCPESLRMKAIGNSMSTAMMARLGRRIKAVEGLTPA
jgi:DNA (cytosine-5)-methyltransferase 1